MLAEAFVVCKEQAFVFFDRPAQRAAEHVALKLRNRAVIKEISSIEDAIAQKFVGAAVQLICAASRDDAHLSARTLPVLCAVSVLNHGKFPDGVHSQ